MAYEPVGDARLPPELKWPLLQWRAEFWLTLVAFLLGLIVFLFPDPGSNNNLRLAVGVPLVLVPLLPVFLWILRVGSVTSCRIRFYPKLHCRAREEMERQVDLRRTLFELMYQDQENHSLELSRAGFDGGKLYVALRKRPKSSVKKGDGVAVFHIVDGMLMGLFTIAQIRDTEFYAIGNVVDPLWLGYIRERGEVTVLPNLNAICFSQGDARWRQ